MPFYLFIYLFIYLNNFGLKFTELPSSCCSSLSCLSLLEKMAVKWGISVVSCSAFRSWATSLLCGNGESGWEYNTSFSLFPCLISLSVSYVMLLVKYIIVIAITPLFPQISATNIPVNRTNWRECSVTWSARFLSHMNHASVSSTDGTGPTQGQRKTLTRVEIEPATFVCINVTFPYTCKQPRSPGPFFFP